MFPLCNLVRLFTVLPTAGRKDQDRTMAPVTSVTKLRGLQRASISLRTLCDRMYFMVTLVSVQLLFSKHIQSVGSLMGPGSTRGTFSVLINCRLVFLSHLSFPFLSSDHCSFSLALGNYFVSFSIVALELNPCNIGKRKQRGCLWSFPWLEKRIRS